MAIDFEEKVEISTEQLNEVSKLAQQQVKLEAELKKKEDELKKVKQNLYNIQEKALPDLMQSIGLEDFTLSNGSHISVKETLYASISKQNKPGAIKWLSENDLESLVSCVVSVPFDKGDGDGVQELLDVLTECGYENIISDEKVNTSSVKSAIKELLEDGEEVPLELFGAYYARKAVVKTKK